MTTWVLLRGLAREARHWGRFPQALQGQLPAADRVVTLDLPGNGARWRETSPASVEGMVASARQALDAAACKPPYVPVALSLGGMVALQWAAAHAGEIRGCVLINSSMGRCSPFWQRLRPGSYATLAALLWPVWTPLQRETRVLRLTSNLPVQQATAMAWGALAESAPISGMNAMRQLAAAARFRAPAARPPVPTLLLASTRDRLVSAACSRAIACAWGAPLREHPDAGHDLPLDDPQWVITQITQWAACLH